MREDAAARFRPGDNGYRFGSRIGGSSDGNIVLARNGDFGIDELQVYVSVVPAYIMLDLCVIAICPDSNAAS